MEYILFVPSELIELIIPYLNDSELISFLEVYDVKNFINWTTVYSLHFLQVKNVDYKEYKTFLSIEKLKEKLNLRWSLEELINLKELFLSNSQIEEIPKEIGELINLRELKLNKNEIKEIPSEIGKLINLKYLYLHNNKIVDVPKEIGELINLRELNLSSNQITEIPPEIGKLTNLKYLYLHNNKIVDVPKGLGNLTNLYNLTIYNNKLSNEEINKIKILLPNARIKY